MWFDDESMFSGTTTDGSDSGAKGLTGGSGGVWRGGVFADGNCISAFVEWTVTTDSDYSPVVREAVWHDDSGFRDVRVLSGHGRV
jgi:hypothetical protein